MEVTPLHIAVWRNNIPAIHKLLQAGADPDIKDGESGWTSLHRALYFGHLRAAVLLIEHGASTTIEDNKGRTPFDLLSEELLPLLKLSEGGEVFTWGSGVNYQLGTGCTSIQTQPTRVEQRQIITKVAASKYHSCAVTCEGELLTWGFGRGGRLGHADFHVHSGQVAIIEPRLVQGLLSRRVISVAAAKHHTIALIDNGEVFTWGSNKDGKLGYPSVDSQPTPRKIYLKQKIVDISAANKHSLAVTSSGDVLAWGSNAKGQLGYGTTDSGSNCTPRIVEAMKKGTVKKVSASKNHSVVVTFDGEVWTWGHKAVTPKRVTFASSVGIKRIGFHNSHTAIFRPNIVEIAAGVAHSTVVSSVGAAFCWNSFDTTFSTFEVRLPDAVKKVSASKERTVVCTENGNVYAWEGLTKRQSEYKQTLDIIRMPHIRRVANIAVGEKHSIAIQAVWKPLIEEDTKAKQKHDQTGSSEEDFLPCDFDIRGDSDNLIEAESSCSDREDFVPLDTICSIPSLHELCEQTLARQCIDIGNVCPLIEFGAVFQAPSLKSYCQKMAIGNMDIIASLPASLQKHLSEEELFELETLLPKVAMVEDAQKTLKMCIEDGALSSHDFKNAKRIFQRSTCSSLSSMDSEHSDLTGGMAPSSNLELLNANRMFFDKESAAEAAACAKSIRSIKKKLQQIERLEQKLDEGCILDEQQISKIKLKQSLQQSLLSIMENGNVEIPSTVKDAEAAEESKDSDVYMKKKKKKQKKKAMCEEASEAVTENFSSSMTPNKMVRRSHEEKEVLTPQSSANRTESSTASSSVDQSPLEMYNYTFPSLNKDFPPIQEAVQSVQSKPAEAHANTTKSKRKSKIKKGALSMFLNGDLDPPKQSIGIIKNTGEASWQANTGDSISLSQIQKEQEGESSIKVYSHSYPARSVVRESPGSKPKKMSLSSFMNQTHKTWNESRSLGENVSLRDIQQEQEDIYKAILHSLSPQYGSSPQTHGGSPSKWYCPEELPIQSLHEILQEEEMNRMEQEKQKKMKKLEETSAPNHSSSERSNKKSRGGKKGDAKKKRNNDSKKSTNKKQEERQQQGRSGGGTDKTREKSGHTSKDKQKGMNKKTRENKSSSKTSKGEENQGRSGKGEQSRKSRAKVHMPAQKSGVLA